MKNNLLIILSLLPFLFISCNDDDNVDVGTPLSIEASGSSIVLDQANKYDAAVTFTWNKGLNRGAGTSVTYCFKLDIAGNNFETSIPLEELGPDVFSKTLSVKELNDLILYYWGKTPGSPVKLEAKVIARVEADKFIKPEVATTTITVEPYNLSSSPLYIVGDATPGGWNAATAIKMTEVDIATIYRIKGEFTVGEYKFIEDRNSLTPSYMQGNTETSLIYQSDEMAEVNNFKIEKAGKYEITVNLRTMEHRKVFYPEYEHIYMVGDATPNEWDINNAFELTWVENTSEFVYEGVLNTGRMRFPLDERSWSTPFLKPMVEFQNDLSDTRMQVVFDGGVDYNWQIDETAFYRITLNLEEMTIKIEKFGDLVYPQYQRVFMVGDATPNGWEINDAYELKWLINTSKFVYEGQLNAGEMKFPLEARDWGSSFLMPPVLLQEDLTDTRMQVELPGSGVDNKWKITNQTAGIYKITVDVENMTIQFEKK